MTAIMGTLSVGCAMKIISLDSHRIGLAGVAALVTSVDVVASDLVVGR